MLAVLMLPAAAMAGPEGVYHVKGVNPDDGQDYTGTVKITRKNELYRVVWQIGNDKTVGIGLGLRLVDGQMVAGPASEDDTGISISYASGETPGSATYTEFSDGTWRGVWAYKGYRKVSTEEWIPTVRQIKAKSFVAFKPKRKPVVTDPVATSRIEEAKAETIRVETTQIRVLPSPLPASASPKS